MKTLRKFFIFSNLIISFTNIYGVIDTLKFNHPIVYGTVQITLYGEELTENEDYFVNYEAGKIYFSEFIARTYDEMDLKVDFNSEIRISDVVGSYVIKKSLSSYNRWKFAAIPKYQSSLFPEAVSYALNANYKRAKIAWFNIDPIFLRNQSVTPSYMKDNDTIQNDPYVREVFQKEIYPNIGDEFPTTFQILNISYYPDERGPSNYTIQLTPEGKLMTPSENWAGITGFITTDTTQNFKYLEFWLMDPFIKDSSSVGGNLYIDYGLISEDILPDNQMSSEAGLYGATISTSWGHIPVNFYLSGYGQPTPDYGLDGLPDADERDFFNSYLSDISSVLNASTYQTFYNDPSGDDYHYYLGSDYDYQQLGILDRYKQFNIFEGNSTSGFYNHSPDNEDLDYNRTLNVEEKYIQFKLEITPAQLNIDNPYIVDTVELHNLYTEHWYKYRLDLTSLIPMGLCTDPNNTTVCLRLFFKDFNQNTFFRFLDFNLVTDTIYESKIVKPDNGFIIYPNPNNGYFGVRTNDIPVKELIVYDFLGKVVFQHQWANPNTLTKAVNLSFLHQGTYLLTIFDTNGNKFSERLLIQ